MPGYNPFPPLQDGVVIYSPETKVRPLQAGKKDPVQTKKSAYVVCNECFNEILMYVVYVDT